MRRGMAAHLPAEPACCTGRASRAGEHESRWATGERMRLLLTMRSQLCGAVALALAALLGYPEAGLAQGKATSEPGKWGAAVVGGAHAGSPERFRGSIGGMFFKKNHNPYGSPGFGVTAEPGLDGGRLSVAAGYISYLGSTLGRVTLLRTWNRAWNAPANATFLGVKGQVPIPFIPASAFRLGVLKRTGTAGDWLWVWSVGVGF